METNDRWLKRPQSTINQRNVDKELQRIKSLGVVSVLNKSFQEITPTSKTSSSQPHVSSSTSTIVQLEDVNGRSRNDPIPSTSLSARRTSSSGIYATSYTNGPVPTSTSARLLSSSKSKSRVVSMGPIITTKPQYARTFAETEMLIGGKGGAAEGDLMTESPVDTDKEVLEKRIVELETLYTMSTKRLHELEAQNKSQSDLLKLQDKLIQCLMDQSEENDTQQQDHLLSCSTNEEIMELEALLKVQQDIQMLSTQVSKLTPFSSECKDSIFNIKEKLSVCDHTLEGLEQVVEKIQKENTAQTLCIDAKVQSLVDKVSQKNNTISKLQQQLRERPPSVISKQVENAISKSNSIKSVNSNIPSLRGDPFDLSPANSNRSSFLFDIDSIKQQSRRSYIARWRGSALPPASPPPSVPLPPIPTTAATDSPSCRRSGSILSEISKVSSITGDTSNIKRVPMDVNVIQQKTSIGYDEIDVQLSDEAYYEEFTNQLKEKLSVSEEINDLRVWSPNDYDYIQKKIDSDWSVRENGENQKEQNAFWKGMKKKLRV